MNIILQLDMFKIRLIQTVFHTHTPSNLLHQLLLLASSRINKADDALQTLVDHEKSIPFETEIHRRDFSSETSFMYPAIRAEIRGEGEEEAEFRDDMSLQLEGNDILNPISNVNYSPLSESVPIPLTKPLPSPLHESTPVPAPVPVSQSSGSGMFFYTLCGDLVEAFTPEVVSPAKEVPESFSGANFRRLAHDAVASMDLFDLKALEVRSLVKASSESLHSGNSPEDETEVSGDKLQDRGSSSQDVLLASRDEDTEPLQRGEDAMSLGSETAVMHLMDHAESETVGEDEAEIETVGDDEDEGVVSEDEDSVETIEDVASEDEAEVETVDEDEDEHEDVASEDEDAVDPHLVLPRKRNMGHSAYLVILLKYNVPYCGTSKSAVKQEIALEAYNEIINSGLRFVDEDGTKLSEDAAVKTIKASFREAKKLMKNGRHAYVWHKRQNRLHAYIAKHSTTGLSKSFAAKVLELVGLNEAEYILVE